ncbi:MAG: V-type ATP synthase subunit D [Candidatus Omnitrophota bacterium]
MIKIKFTKGELKKQRDALRQYLRYLPTLQLKKQQLQMEILHWHTLEQERDRVLNSKMLAAAVWAGLLAQDTGVDMRQWLVPSEIVTKAKNIAGVDLPVFEQAVFPAAEYDLFVVAPWVDRAIESLQEIVSLRQEIIVIKRAIAILKNELRITAQRVNLFEKVKVPESQEAIRRIKIYIGDQMANAVGRCKIAKRKIEEFEALEVAA